ncbi:MAG TPA: hypothetical protein VJ184_06165 [Chryseolinea sp.]|nr:hypothetical protein [Chryseolinea sp.]
MVPIVCQGQLVKPDTTVLAKAKENTKKIYFQSIKGQSRLYNGSDHIMYQSKEDEHPYFPLDDWTSGTIVYDANFYENVPLMYDISQDKVLTEHVLNGSVMELVGKKIERFTMQGQVFVRLGKDDGDKINEGFYEMLYPGLSKVYAKHEKVRQEYIVTHELFARFDAKTKYFIFKDGTYFPVQSKSSVVRVFGDRKQDVKRFIAKNSLSFNANRGKAIAQIAAFYDSQKN